MAGLGAPELLIIFLLLAFIVLPIWGIVDAAVRPDALWAATGQSKILWIILQVVLGTLGALIYFAAIRPKPWPTSPWTTLWPYPATPPGFPKTSTPGRSAGSSFT
jgi:hypothetical protein